MTIQFKYAALTDVGLIRKSNQDAGYASSRLLVVADGMGGAAGGDIASSVVVAHLAEIDDTHQAEELLPLLRQQLNIAHEELIERTEEDADLAGLGTTCIAILRTGNKLGMVHVGDSRAYVLRGDRLAQVTRDHTLVQYLLDKGQITPEEALHHPKRNVIMRNIGDSPEPIELDESIREAVNGDRWLLCSDGLYDVVSRETLTETLRTFQDLDECAEKLVELALAGGAPDNVTVVLADVIDTDSGVAFSDKPVVVGAAAVDHRRPTRAKNTPAAQAAALSAATKPADTLLAPEELEEDQPRRGLARFAAVLAILVLVLGGLGGGYAWTQTRYFVSTHDGNVAIFKGIPQDIGPITLSELYEETDIAVEDLTEVAQERLRTPITRASLPEARAVVDNFADQVVEPKSSVDTSTPLLDRPIVFPDTKIGPQNDMRTEPTPLPSVEVTP
ncbi:MAG: serine/threonine-protein phosphatase [Actinomycetaceae bacterium]|nr:serine/threonine-protein phosphatase [Actinomycetaceae bacterium]